MPILAIETSHRCGGVALVDSGRVVGEVMVDAGRTYSNTLFPSIDALLRICNIDYGDIRGVAVGIGPGSFTGLRIGIASAKGVSYSLGIPLIGVPSLDAMVIDVVCSQPDAILCPMLDAKKRQVFTSTYEMASGTIPRRTGPYMAIRPNAFLKGIDGERPYILFGEGVAVYEGQFREYLEEHSIENVVLLPHARPYSRPGCIGMLGEVQFQRGESAWGDLFTLEPIYCRPSDAEIKRYGLDSTCFLQG